MMLWLFFQFVPSAFLYFSLFLSFSFSLSPSVSLSHCLYLSMSLSLSFSWSFLSVCLCPYMSICLSLSIDLFIYLPIYLFFSVSPSLAISIFWYLRTPIHQSAESCPWSQCWSIIWIACSDTKNDKFWFGWCRDLWTAAVLGSDQVANSACALCWW